MEKFMIVDIIEKLYNSQIEELDNKILELQKQLKINQDNKDISKLISEVKDEEIKKKINIIIDKVKDEENKKTSIYNKEMYKQGFVDGINLILNCITNK